MANGNTRGLTDERGSSERIITYPRCSLIRMNAPRGGRLPAPPTLRPVPGIVAGAG